MFVELILYILACKFTQKELLRGYFLRANKILLQFLIFYDLDLYRQNVEVVVFFQNLVVAMNRVRKMEQKK